MFKVNMDLFSGFVKLNFACQAFSTSYLCPLSFWDSFSACHTKSVATPALSLKCDYFEEKIEIVILCV